jgi:hypothetical protein
MLRGYVAALSAAGSPCPLERLSVAPQSADGHVDAALAALLNLMDPGVVTLLDIGDCPASVRWLMAAMRGGAPLRSLSLKGVPLSRLADASPAPGTTFPALEDVAVDQMLLLDARGPLLPPADPAAAAVDSAVLAGLLSGVTELRSLRLSVGNLLPTFASHALVPRLRLCSATLRSLSLPGMALGDEGVCALAAVLPSLPCLSSLDLRAVGVESDGLAALGAALPRLRQRWCSVQLHGNVSRGPVTVDFGPVAAALCTPAEPRVDVEPACLPEGAFGGGRGADGRGEGSGVDA